MLNITALLQTVGMSCEQLPVTRKLCYCKDDHTMHQKSKQTATPLGSCDSRLTQFNQTLWT